MKSAIRLLDLDRPVLFALAGRAAQLIAAPLVAFSIARFFSPTMQGFYYTFASLLALQSFVELGFYVVIINLASHEWASLAFDDRGHLIGDVAARSRLVSLGRLVARWYAVAALLFVVGVGAAGMVYFGRAHEQIVVWRGPWLVLTLVTGLQLCLLPMTALLEGCNQVATVQRFRLVQAVGGSSALVVAIALGAGLWAAVVVAAVRLACDSTLVFVRYRGLIRAFRSPPEQAFLSWRHDVWPMQWRLALSGIVNYFAFSLFNPVMFTYHGAAVAGQMGMTWQGVGALQAMALVWISTRVPRFGLHIAQRDYAGLHKLWWHTSLLTVGLFAAAALTLWLSVVALNFWQIPLGARLLAPLPTAYLLAAVLLMQVSQCQTAYMRAHRKEPIVVMSVTTSIAAGLAVWTFGRTYGPVGATSGYCAVMVGLVVWETAIFKRFRANAMAAAGVA